MPSAHEELIASLKAALGPSGWLDGEDMAPHRHDWRGNHQGTPLLVVRPATTAETQTVVEICRRHDVNIVTQGGNTGLSGGSITTDDASVLLSTSRMRAIIDVDPEGFTITAEAGATIEALQDAARAQDRQLALDWGARGSATIGGAVSTDAGGINVLRSGTTRSQVLGLEVVLPDGRVWDGLRSLRKDASGYGLRHLFIGAEGTLGVVTKVVLSLEPLPHHQRTLFATVSDFDRLPALYALANEMGEGRLAAFELIPETGLARTITSHGVMRPLEAEADWYVLAQFQGRTPVEAVATDFLERAIADALIGDAVVADTAAQEANLWLMRDELPPEKLFGVKGAKFDAAVPIQRVAEYFDAVKEVAASIDPGIVPYAFGHLGDGNLHLYLLAGLQPAVDMAPETVANITDAVDQLTWAFGGTISAEHGIGQELRGRMAGQKSEVELDLLTAVKEAIDPDNRFNPGKGAHSARDTRSGEDEGAL